MTPTLRVTQVIARLRPEDGGPSYSVPSLAAGLQRIGVESLVRFVDWRGAPSTRLNGFAFGAHRAQGNFVARLFCVSCELEKALDADALGGSVLHAHGLWLAPNLYPAWAKRKSGGKAKLVHSPRGMLGDAALDISNWKKKAFWHCAQHSALLSADCLHATALSEYEEIRRAGLKTPVAVIPNGIDLPNLQSSPRSPAPENFVLSLGRIHPKKGLDRLVRAWAQLEREFPAWRLRIIGPSEHRHDEELRALALALGTKNTTIEQPLYGEAKSAALRSASLFVLPTLNENFAITVAEALAAETPVISTKGAPWAGLEGERCGWWIDHGVEPLVAVLRDAMAMPREERIAMGARGRQWMARDFGWDRIAADMVDVYQWLRVGGEAPASVRTS